MQSNTASPTTRTTTPKLSLFIETLRAGQVAFSSDDKIRVNADYIQGFSSDVRKEITRILYHEVVHSWQWNGKGQAPVDLIKGIADFVRMKAGYAGNWRQLRSGNKWDESYDITAWFLDYCNGLRNGFVAELNKKMRTGCSDDFFVELLGKTVDQFWRRPRKQRRKEPDEPKKGAKLRRSGITVVCKKCGRTGHNKRTCKGVVGGNKFLPGESSGQAKKRQGPTASKRAAPTVSPKGGQKSGPKVGKRRGTSHPTTSNSNVTSTVTQQPQGSNPTPTCAPAGPSTNKRKKTSTRGPKKGLKRSRVSNVLLKDLHDFSMISVILISQLVPNNLALVQTRLHSS
ncbi:hypothetical protein C3L33_20958, partial [Rhododendron williamsianum]